MDFFNIGTPELIVIALIGLLLFGPEDLLKFARTASGYLRSAQRMWRGIASELTVDLSTLNSDADHAKGPMSAEPPSEITSPLDETFPEAGYGP